MKFLALAVVALFGLAESKKAPSKDVLKARISNGDVNKRTLMKGATPYNDKAKRMLEDAEFEITGEYSVKFNSCTSLSILDEDLFDEDMLELTQNGVVVAEQSFILFDVCYGSCNGGYGANTFITDIPNFFDALIDYIPNKKATYCEACEENQNYCYQLKYGNGDDAYAANYDNQGDGGRALANNAVQMIDCDQCDAWACFNGNDDDSLESGIEWIQELGECMEVEGSYFGGGNDDGGIQQYLGLLCNEEGNGVEIGVFLNEDCTLYTPYQAFGNLMSSYDYQYFRATKDYVEYTFMSEFSCYDPEIEYSNPYADQDENGNDDQGEDNGEAPEAGEYCADLFDDNVVDLYTCGGYQADNDGNQDNDDEGDDNYNWYVYQLSDEDADDAQAACAVIQGYVGQATSVYDKQGSGYMYNYNGQAQTEEDLANSTHKEKSGKSGLAIFFVLVLLLAGAAGGAYWYKTQQEDSKKEPLVGGESETQGTLA
eukprot:CAMPEP_0117038930 /NCGR_PEP_ID=MMETSP0472-20121206/27356_1 /TAXON_ID=693140 ORGANISM="Tiarina fusus, Strain LIS" /NCGR_SAMPLE_ID=MMETSP0472 /ASSEMBLY_ACC=CAM_ASM_000603 /LENGTH=484 /DNA_ID=CAMNT_0004749283 /DNA_START=23 /DNA_END=1477 /DNA_ORIENTATION=+